MVAEPKMVASFTKFDDESNWVKGVCEQYTFHAKLFDFGSGYGIDEGRVSKLTIIDGTSDHILNYDRGWDIRPHEKHIPAYKAIMHLLENAPKRFED